MLAVIFFWKFLRAEKENYVIHTVMQICLKLLATLEILPYLKCCFDFGVPYHLDALFLILMRTAV
jgi:hypothetical protein